MNGLVRYKELIPAIRGYGCWALLEHCIVCARPTTLCLIVQQLCGQSAYTLCGAELSQSVQSCARHGTMVFNGRIETGNVAGDLRAIPATSESAGRPLKSGYLVDSRKWLVSVSGEMSATCGQGPVT